MHEDVKVYVHNCLICQQTKHDTTLPFGLLQPFLMEEAQAQAHMQAHQRVDLGQP